MSCVIANNLGAHGLAGFRESFPAEYCQVGVKREDYGREVDPNAVTQEARSGEQKASFYLKAVYKNQKPKNGDEKQSSNQRRDKGAKQKYKVQIKHGKKNAKQSKTY